MSNKQHMTNHQAVFMSIGLGIVVLLLLIPLWQGMAWSKEVIDEPIRKAATAPAVTEETVEEETVVTAPAVTAKVVSGSTIEAFLDKDAKTLEDRVLVPEGYTRTEADEIVSFLRNYPVRKTNAKVKYYNGQIKPDQSDVVTILKLPLERSNTQQQTSSVQRVFAEYFWRKQDYDRISFLLPQGMQADYVRWREGYRLSADATSWVESGQPYNDSYAGLQQYLMAIFVKTNADTLIRESEKLKLSAAEPGDLLVEGGANGSTAMIVDVCVNANGEKAFLLARGGKPAQYFHVIKNPLHEDDPWYYQAELTKEIQTPGHTFSKKSVYRVKY